MFDQFKPGTVTDGRVWYALNQSTPELQIIFLGLFAYAIAKFEGFYIPDSISQRNRNPGNLRPIGASTGFRTFETDLDGWSALKKQILINVNRGLTLREFFLGKPGVYPGYAPLGDNDAEVMENYISSVANTLSIPQNIDLRTYLPSYSDVTGSSVPLAGILYGYKLYAGE